MQAVPGGMGEWAGNNTLLMTGFLSFYRPVSLRLAAITGDKRKPDRVRNRYCRVAGNGYSYRNLEK